MACVQKRNNCRGDDFLILLAICRAENGGPGREFGIKHRLCRAAIKREPEPVLIVMPREDDTNRCINTRIKPMF
jgi:hypothetical protein